MEKTLSIIVPTYNMEKYLRKCLDSLIVSDENMQRLEVLVINDGSKDSSSQIAHEYEAKYPQTFRVIDKENGNYGSCVNRGLIEATGKYVKVLDADDTFANNVFDSYLSFLSATNADLVISPFDIVDEDGVLIKAIRFSLPSDQYFSLSALSREEGFWLWHHAIAYKKELFKKFEYHQTERISYSDEEWVFKPMTMVKDVVYFNQVLYLYLRGREGQTYDPKVLQKARDQKDKMVNALVEFYEKYKNKVIDSGAASFMYDRIMMILSNMYKYYLFDSKTAEGSGIISGYDSQLKHKCNFLYEAMGQFLFKPKLRYNYIKRWRKVHYNQNDLCLSCYNGVYRIINLLKK